MADTTHIDLVCCTQVLLQDIARKEMLQKHIALTYSMAIRSEQAGADKPDWKTINEAIASRWKKSGLNRIKNLAWKYIDGSANP